ncbi:MAG: uridine kinase [Aristaeellaceae bacterium]
MEFLTCLREQLRLHPAMQPQDVFKLCYQAARGAEHLLADTARARAYFDREYAATPADAGLPLFEVISPDVARVNLAAWKAAALPPGWLFRMFADTARIPMGGDDPLEAYLSEADTLLAAAMPGWTVAISAWRAQGLPAIHHSEAYRDAEHPAYRIVKRQFQCILPILERLHQAQDVRVIALDGRAASGKTTKAALLSAVLDAPVIHMDDFFLPPTLRTPERLAQPGGNVHCERFREEVLPRLATGEAFSCRVFDCGRMDYAGVREIPAGTLRIVEGSYALHPEFGDYADLRIFCTVDAQEQMARILRRNGERMADMFRTRWIPMEERYFSHFRIREKADLCL